MSSAAASLMSFPLLSHGIPGPFPLKTLRVFQFYFPQMFTLCVQMFFKTLAQLLTSVNHLPHVLPADPQWIGLPLLPAPTVPIFLSFSGLLCACCLHPMKS